MLQHAYNRGMFFDVAPTCTAWPTSRHPKGTNGVQEPRSDSRSSEGQRLATVNIDFFARSRHSIKARTIFQLQNVFHAAN